MRCDDAGSGDLSSVKPVWESRHSNFGYKKCWKCIIKPLSSGTPVRMRPWHAARKSPKDIRIPSVGFVSAIVSRSIVYLMNSFYEIPPHASPALREDGMRRVLQNKRDPRSPCVTFPSLLPPESRSNSSSPFILFESGTPNLISPSHCEKLVRGITREGFSPPTTLPAPPKHSVVCHCLTY